MNVVNEYCIVQIVRVISKNRMYVQDKYVPICMFFQKHVSMLSTRWYT